MLLSSRNVKQRILLVRRPALRPSLLLYLGYSACLRRLYFWNNDIQYYSNFTIWGVQSRESWVCAIIICSSPYSSINLWRKAYASSLSTPTSSPVGISWTSSAFYKLQMLLSMFLTCFPLSRNLQVSLRFFHRLVSSLPSLLFHTCHHLYFTHYLDILFQVWSKLDIGKIGVLLEESTRELEFSLGDEDITIIDAKCLDPSW